MRRDAGSEEARLAYASFVMPVPCSGCARMMSAAAVVCPHCGARQSDRDPIAANTHRRALSRDDGVSVDPYRGEPLAEASAPDEPPKKKPLEISSEETRALFEVTGIASGAMEYERPTGPMVLVLPRAEAAGFVRALEWVLTVLAAPMIALGIVPMFLRPRLWRFIAEGSEWGLTLMSGFVGGMMLWSIAGLSRLSDPAAWGIMAVCGGALVGRAILRSLPMRRL